MQLDLAHPKLPKLPQLPDFRHGTKHARTHWFRLAAYLALAVLAVWLLSWSRAQSRRVVEAGRQAAVGYAADRQADFLVALKGSALPATELTAKGLALVPTNPMAGSVLLQTAAAKDPKYRDAALGAGYAELAIADPLWANDPTAAHAHTATASKFLEAAKSIDPIYSKTYELLALAYGNLGETTLAADASKKAQDFAVRS